MDWKTLFLRLEGRIGRRDFWLGFLLIFVTNAFVQIVPGVGQLISLLLIWPMIAIYAKRLHDMGKTGWLQLAPFVVGLVCVTLAAITGGAAVISAAAMGEAGRDAGAAAAVLTGAGSAIGFIGLAFLAYLAFLLWVGLTPGEPGENRFGPPPVPLVTAL